ncbi:hypothetical protein [Woodsholea maritima]|uniref:hypothetical protein n=1 Tax=Woodsholea maritima TaxID=240237 RepID=UPI00038113BA|nr:hypothetical protein [Woodsholea maritima]
MTKTILLAVVLGAILLAAVIASVITWLSIDSAMTWHGYLALFLGVVISLGLGGGLMALSFYSSRSGWDEAAHDDRDV